jgi:hypothetical protein
MRQHDDAAVFSGWSTDRIANLTRRLRKGGCGASAGGSGRRGDYLRFEAEGSVVLRARFLEGF